MHTQVHLKQFPQRNIVFDIAHGLVRIHVRTSHNRIDFLRIGVGIVYLYRRHIG
ncbi:hypothetical protein SDC9_208910 [bioreactor metagenome]|uniref:Uncharacterized protein n=1 Tax=bioreactor metagenome TaxID=1076179 RepID=A0A645JCK9_9ZZZZ